MEKTDSVVLITGAAGGLGRATAVAFAAAGYRLALADLDAAALGAVADNLRASHDTECAACPGDLSEQETAETTVDRALAAFGRLDVLVNNAAWRTLETLRTMDWATWERTLRVCLTAPAFLAQRAAAAMEAAGRPGVIVNVSSVMAARAGGTSPAYVAAKGGLESLTRELAVTYGRSGIRVVGVAPGSVDTALSRDYRDPAGADLSQRLVGAVNEYTPLGRPGTPAEIAAAIYWLSTDAAAFVTGTTLAVDGGFGPNFSSYALKRLQYPQEF